jgi:hypothetical protein
VALLLDYIFNFFIDPQKEKINREDIFPACEKALYESLPLLPDNPSSVPSSIKIKLPVALPITHTKDTTLVARALSAHYKFDFLPSSYFLQKPDLPEHVEDLPESYRDTFPIRTFEQMRNIRELINLLKDEFYVPNKLPNSYLDLPPKKKQLPNDYRDLPPHLAVNFPVLNNKEDIIKMVALLRNNNFYLQRIPLDWIRNKSPLPPPY